MVKETEDPVNVDILFAGIPLTERGFHGLIGNKAARYIISYGDQFLEAAPVITVSKTTGKEICLTRHIVIASAASKQKVASIIIFVSHH